MHQLSAEKELSKVGIVQSLAHPIQSMDLQRKTARTKLWQLDHNYHCAVVGTCLTMAEVKKLLKQLYIECNGFSDYDLHTTFVTIIANHDFRSKKIQNYLDKKFKTAIQNIRKLSAEELTIEWQNVLNRGDIIGTFWAIMSHQNTDAGMKRVFYGDMHMLSHLSGASNRADLKRLNQLEKERKELAKENCTLQSKLHKTIADNIRLLAIEKQQNEKHVDLVSQVHSLSEAIEKLLKSKAEKQRQQLILQIEKLNINNTFQENDIKKYQNKASLLTKSVSEAHKQISIIETAHKKEVDQLQNEINLLQNQQCQLKTKNLCGQCVLYVGGKANLIPYYRELVESKSGVFLHHDGGIEKSTQDLSHFLNRADWVIFPSGCISHKAYWQIKRTCKKQHKPYKYLNSPGLYSLGNELDKIIANTETLNA